MSNESGNSGREIVEIDNDCEMNDNENRGNTDDVTCVDDYNSSNIIPQLTCSQGEVELACSSNNGHGANREHSGENDSIKSVNDCSSNKVAAGKLTNSGKAFAPSNECTADNRKSRQLTSRQEEVNKEYGSEATRRNTNEVESVEMVSDGSFERGAIGFDHEYKSNKSIKHDQFWEKSAYGVLNGNINRNRTSINEHGEYGMDNNQNTDYKNPVNENCTASIGADTGSNTFNTDQRDEAIRSGADSIIFDRNQVNRTDGVNTLANNFFIGSNAIRSIGSKKSDDISNTYSEAAGEHRHSKIESASNSTMIPFAGEEQFIRNDTSSRSNTSNTNSLSTVQDHASISAGAHILEANNHSSYSIDYDTDQQGGAIGFEKISDKQSDAKSLENYFKSKSLKKKRNESQTNVNGPNSHNTLLKKLFSDHTITQNYEGNKTGENKCFAIPDDNITTDNTVNTGGDGFASYNTNNDGVDEDHVNQTDGESNENGAYGGNDYQAIYHGSRSGLNEVTPTTIATFNTTAISRTERDRNRNNDYNYAHDTDDTIISLNRPGIVDLHRIIPQIEVYNEIDMHFRLELYPNDREATEPSPNLHMPRAGGNHRYVGEQGK
ncbi:hypothetical protein DPMN_032086 [Dreissena polymorpha]|uniref:Uncharacterized protein n=1 Tax=Dreissena polymorpha TaxID=45954 RepID=A0A9D4M5W0_DREPO|nr:hypothetical protein DPMN_032086 [Dreissena polymorpha]